MTKAKTPEEKALSKEQKANAKNKSADTGNKKAKVKETRFMTNAGKSGRVKRFSM